MRNNHWTIKLELYGFGDNQEALKLHRDVRTLEQFTREVLGYREMKVNTELRIYQPQDAEKQDLLEMLEASEPEERYIEPPINDEI